MLNNKSESYTFRELHDNVSRLAGVMKTLGKKLFYFLTLNKVSRKVIESSSI